MLVNGIAVHPGETRLRLKQFLSLKIIFTNVVEMIEFLLQYYFHKLTKFFCQCCNENPKIKLAILFFRAKHIDQFHQRCMVVLILDHGLFQNVIAPCCSALLTFHPRYD